MRGSDDIHVRYVTPQLDTVLNPSDDSSIDEYAASDYEHAANSNDIDIDAETDADAKHIP